MGVLTSLQGLEAHPEEEVVSNNGSKLTALAASDESDGSCISSKLVKSLRDSIANSRESPKGEGMRFFVISALVSRSTSFGD